MSSRLSKLAAAILYVWIGYEWGRRVGHDDGYMDATIDYIRRDNERRERAGEIDRYGMIPTIPTTDQSSLLLWVAAVGIAVSFGIVLWVLVNGG